MVLSLNYFQSDVVLDRVILYHPYILALEVLACQIWDDDEIKGILVNVEEIKLTLFVGNMTCLHTSKGPVWAQLHS